MEKKKSEHIRQANRRKIVNEKLCRNYKKRVENFLVNMRDAPVVVNDFKALDTERYNFRQDDQPEKFLGFGIFKMKSSGIMGSQMAQTVRSVTNR